MGAIRSHTYKSINEFGEVIEIPKKAYDDERSAVSAAKKINAYGHDIHKMVAYKCCKCDKWHIGHNYTVMTDRRRETEREKMHGKSRLV